MFYVLGIFLFSLIWFLLERFCLILFFKAVVFSLIPTVGVFDCLLYFLSSMSLFLLSSSWGDFFFFITVDVFVICTLFGVLGSLFWETGENLFANFQSITCHSVRRTLVNGIKPAFSEISASESRLESQLDTRHPNPCFIRQKKRRWDKSSHDTSRHKPNQCRTGINNAFCFSSRSHFQNGLCKQ